MLRVEVFGGRYAGLVPAAPRPSAELRRGAESFEDYLRVERGASPRTIEAYRRDVKRYLSALARAGVTEVGEIQPSHVLDFLGERAGTGAAASTLNRTLAAVRHFHRFCVREGIAPQNPASLVDGPARGRPLPKALSAEDVTKIIEAAAGASPREQRDRAILELLYGAGLRVSELVRLDVDDVDLDERTIRCIGKGEKERVVPVGVPAADAVRRYLGDGRRGLASAGRPTHALFLRVGGGRLSRQSAWRCVKRYAARVNPNARVFPHALRHSFATHLVAGGADVRVVQEALGHARLSTTQVYTLVTRDKLKDVYEAAHPRGRERRRRSS
ncbi:MAG: site-specific tyrosine recombinase XerD [Actinomycetota bacterium]